MNSLKNNYNLILARNLNIGLLTANLANRNILGCSSLLASLSIEIRRNGGKGGLYERFNS